MVTIFVDSAALLAIINVEDVNHAVAKNVWKGFLEDDTILVTNNYVILESIALIQNRLGIRSVQKLYNELLPLIDVHWIDSDQHHNALNHVLEANRRNLSLVDCSSFDTMRRLGVSTVFTFDEHFREQGFKTIP